MLGEACGKASEGASAATDNETGDLKETFAAISKMRRLFADLDWQGLGLDEDAEKDNLAIANSRDKFLGLVEEGLGILSKSGATQPSSFQPTYMGYKKKHHVPLGG